MTFQVGTWAVDGNQIDAVVARQMMYAMLLGSQGTVGHLDCIVTANAPATSGINIGSGNVGITGAESGNQGQAYFGANIGTDTSLSIAAAGPSGRSDMVIVRAEDPTWSGSPWGNPPSGQIVFPRVLSNVGSGATTVPGGYSAIPLARIDMPANATVVQSSYIHDLRQVANPQRSTQMFVAAGSNPGTSSQGNGNLPPVQWPPGADFTVQIPAYATQCVVYYTLTDVLYQNVGNGAARGWTYIGIGSSVTAPITATGLDLFSYSTSTGPGRHVLSGGGQVAIPASIRGTSQSFQFIQNNDTSNTATFLADEGTAAVLILEFFQQAALA